MKYAVYKLHFSTGIHIGNRALTDGEYTINSDTIFSALCQEALKAGGSKYINKLVNLVRSGSLLISDALPFIEDDLYVPKPLQPVSNEDSTEDQDYSIKKKIFKKLKYISIEMLEIYMEGELDPELEVEIFKELGDSKIKTSAWITGTEETKPYFVGVYNFNPNKGLYIIIAYKDEDALIFMETLIKGLGYTGIGGKRSSGLGKFKPKSCEPSEELISRLNNQNYQNYMTLSSCMANKNEMEDAMIDSHYLLHKRSGFISSKNYAMNNLKKRDFYAFKSGSCFSNKFIGDIFDVSYNGEHPVYRYAKPMFLGVM